MKFYDNLETPVGKITIEADETHILSVRYDHPSVEASPNDLTDKCKAQLLKYFAGKLRNFDLPLKLQGTEFQETAWKALLKIPYGKTFSYKEQANTIDKPTASRAVGLANGKNKLSIVVPCHRVIGANGSLTGYAGGLERKSWLLEHEKVLSS